MTTGPRNTPHPIILHVDDQGNPVRLAEASSIYVTTVSAVNISATNYLGLGGGGRPEGVEGSIQFKSNNNAFAGEEGFTYDNNTFTLNVLNINSNNTITAENLRSDSASSTNLSAINIRAITLSATTVCATNYDTLLDALSFQNLDNRYLNSSGDSVTGSVYIQTLSSTNLSATNWLGLPSALATWNANAIQGISVTSTQPTLGQTLIYKDGIWQPSSVAGVAGGNPGGGELTVQFRNGSFFSGVDSIKYNSSISGIESIGLSSTNLRSNTLLANVVCATIVSATDYLNLGEDTAQWNASKIYGTPFNKGELITGDFISYEGGSWTNVTKEEAAALVSPQLHTETWNASGLRGYQVTSTAPTTNNVLIYNGSFWTPSASVVLGSIASNNLASINSSSTNLSAINARITGLSSTTLSSISARITGLSATTISATDWQGLPSAVATWNASVIRGSNIVEVDSGLTLNNPIGVFIYNKGTNEYFTLPFSSVVLNGSRDGVPATTQGKIAASYLTSANDTYFGLNPIWKLANDLPENKDVLTFSSNLYGVGLPGWTWIQPSTVVPAAGPYEGFIQFRGPNGEFSSVPNFHYDSTYSSLTIPKTMYFPTSGYLEAYWITARGNVISPYVSSNNIDVATQIRSNIVSATTYKLFGANTSSTGTVTANNQTITYDSGASRWKPGYAVFQATATPIPEIGSNGDIYFQYLP